MAKKSFLENINPALSIINTTPATAPEALTPATTPSKQESKSRRLQLLIKPSLYLKIQKVASLNGNSVNDTIHTLLEESTKEN